MRLSHLNSWRALESVLRRGSVTSAAKELGVSPAAVTSQIRTLERRLDRMLFERVPGGLVPFDDVRQAGARLTQGLSFLEDVQSELSGATASRQVALTVTQTFAETVLPRHLPELFAHNEAVDIRLETTWDVVDLHRSEMHFAIRFMGPIEESHQGIDLMPSGVVPACTPEFAQRYGLNPETRSLAEVPLIRIDVPTSDPDWVNWSEWSQRTAVPIKATEPDRAPLPQVALSGSGLKLARSGIGLVLGGLSEILYAVEDGSLVFPLGHRSIVPSSYWHRLIWLKERRLGPAQQSVRDWVEGFAARDRERMDNLFGV